MARRRSRAQSFDVWPGYVDALSTLLMVIIFVLLVFVLAQGFLSTALSNRDRALDRLNAQVAELAELLSLERGQAAELRQLLTRASDDLRGATGARDTLSEQLRGLNSERDALAGDATSLRGERDRLAARLADLEAARAVQAQQLTRAETQLAEALGRAESATGDTALTVQRLNEQARASATARAASEQLLAEANRNLAAQQAARAAATRSLAEANQALTAERATRAGIEQRLAELQRGLSAEQTARATAERQARETTGALETARQELATIRRQAAEAAARAAEMERRIAALQAQAEALNRTVTTDRATIEARLADLARLQQDIARLNALREQAERAAQTAQAATASEAQRRQGAEGQAAEQQRLSEAARAQVALLTRQLEELRGQLNRLANALDASEARDRENDAQVVNLRAQLNAALASRVEELQRYRSEFFGRLREVLGDRPELRIVGDRFIFQSEVLFPPASAELSAVGQQQLRQLSRVLFDIASRIPPEIPWLLRVDGHADRSPIRSNRYATNWELSAARAIAVANLLIEAGLPANRVAAAAFGEHQPIDPADTPEAYARNRRIELRLTDR
ncbi:peptidoglycan -binding protein [Roseococcus sp.]|uniref:peptidoglycan -binding protein n=1 Tax=Roseococcus sp. TaxID=2109646 RepID=UPI003BA8B442